MCCLHKASKGELKGWGIHGKAVPCNALKVSERETWGRGHVQSSPGGPVPDTFSSPFCRFSVIPTVAFRVPVCFVFCSGWACLFFPPEYSKSQLIFLDRLHGDNNVGFSPLSINKASEKPTYYRAFSSGLCYLNLLGGLEEHKHIFQGQQLQWGELWAPAIVPSCQHVAWCHRAGGGTRGDDSTQQHLLLPPRCAWTQLSLCSSFHGSF